MIRESNSQLYFVFEYMPDGNLYELIEKCQSNERVKQSPSYIPFTSSLPYSVDLSLEKIQAIVRQILKALSYIHHLGFMHRDIKPENLLLQGQTCKIADFGLSRLNRKEKEPPLTHSISTRWYRAPELLLCSAQYGPPIDIFAVGCVMVEMMTLKPLFPGQSEIDQIEKIFVSLGIPTNNSWREGLLLLKKMRIGVSEEKNNFHRNNGMIKDDNFPCQNRSRKFLEDKIPTASNEMISLLLNTLHLDPGKRAPAKILLNSSYFSTSPYSKNTELTNYISPRSVSNFGYA